MQFFRRQIQLHNPILVSVEETKPLVEEKPKVVPPVVVHEPVKEPVKAPEPVKVPEPVKTSEPVKIQEQVKTVDTPTTPKEDETQQDETSALFEKPVAESKPEQSGDDLNTPLVRAPSSSKTPTAKKGTSIFCCF